MKVASKEAVALETMRHSAAHLMAQAVSELYPGAKLGIGPAIEEGFYYDFDLPVTLSPEDLPPIEKKMRELQLRDDRFEREELDRKQASELFDRLRQDYKVELIEDLPDETVSIHRNGGFADLCRGPHVGSTGEIGAFKLLSVAGAYWRGDEHRPMLQRIYGTAFSTQQELDEYLHRLEEAKRRDHRALGKQLDLFSFHDEAPGFPFYHPKGMVILNNILAFWRAVHERRGYREIKTPIILRRELWERSGHWENYRDSMYFTAIDDGDFAVKPMNCPGGLLIYRSETRSYRDLPMRIAELGLVHRHELSGVLHGLFRVRAFTQDDAHIYCTPEQIEGEVIGVIDLTLHLYRAFGFEDWEMELSTRPDKGIGSDEMWERAESALKNALEHRGIDYQLNLGQGAFYGPKIDFHIRDAIGRKWQCATIQLDFAMPERFDLEYIGPDNRPHRPAMIHRAILGSLERFLGVLLEHYAGALPVWLSPVQAKVSPIADRHLNFARQVAGTLQEAGVRVEVDDRREQVGYKIRSAQVEKIPYMLVVGDREIEQGAVAVRERSGANLGAQPVSAVAERISREGSVPDAGGSGR